jgi:hypothetical protein
MADIRLVPVHLAPMVWEELHTQLKGAMRYHMAMDVNDLLVLLERNMVAMFAAIDDDELKGCFIVNVEEFPRKRVCNIVVVAGKNGSTRGWVDDMLQAIEDWAGQRGCDVMAGIGRKGWMVAKEYGWKVEQRAILVKEIADAKRRRRVIETSPGTLEAGTTVP